ncbi:NAD(+) diphosphatase [Rhizosaccharibacter radicis]|uniref:NAD(+) diphosphatase n=1 Tax=Rhizosaccharibacter radicis TaxID=2782605 RepID=A0ABT1VY53_9PROT|nr:NAD(+) diphosphatase [Acetobacteraceae bacterium KSS12]
MASIPPPGSAAFPAGANPAPLSPVVNFYAGSPLDRAAELRTDEAAIERLLADASSLFVPVWRNRHLVSGLDADGAPDGSAPPGAAMVPLSALVPSAAALAELPWVLLGFEGAAGSESRRALFAVTLDAEPEPALLPSHGRFAELRPVAGELPPAHAAILAQARGMLHWHATHRFCATCGRPTRSEHGGYRRSCDEGHLHFPRTDPAVIMMVEHRDDAGEERVLLARNARFGERRVFSVLAGFVEPGESLEEAVAREVWEETGVRVTDVRYHSSQPWPFPGSIMLGFSARAASAALAIDGEEIVEAFWASRDQLRRPGEHDFVLPGKGSIALRMLENWLERAPAG